jgi:hypothetical protein
MDSEVDLLAQVYALILAWPEPGETGPSGDFDEATEEPGEKEPALMGGSSLIVPAGEKS